MVKSCFLAVSFKGNILPGFFIGIFGSHYKDSYSHASLPARFVGTPVPSQSQRKTPLNYGESAGFRGDTEMFSGCRIIGGIREIQGALK